MNIDGILGRLIGVRRTSGGWAARCPAHEDKNASLAVAHGEKGVVLYCHAGCTPEAVCSKLGISTRDLFDTEGATSPATAPATSPAKSGGKVHPTLERAIEAAAWGLSQGGEGFRCVGQWKYHNEHGDHVASVARFETSAGRESKVYRPVHRNGTGWKVTDPSGMWPLYRLPALLAADAGQTVCMAEGEKCADTLAELGLTATAIAHGAGAAKRNKLTGETKTDFGPLAGRNCMVFLDNDESGEGFGRDIVERLSELTPPARAKLVRFPELAAGGDVADFIASLNVTGEAARAALREYVAKHATRPATASELPAPIQTAAPAPGPMARVLEAPPAATPAAPEGAIILPSKTHPIRESAGQVFGILAERELAFLRGGRVHEVNADADGRLRLEPVTPEAFRTRIEALGATLEAVRHKEELVLVPRRPAEADCRAILAAREREALPPIETIFAAPVLVEEDDNGKTLGRGYHRRHACLVTSGTDTPDVPPDEAARALESLLVDFDFVTGADKARALAMICSAAFRFGQLVARVPLFVAEADRSQTGKGYLVECVATLFGEHPAIVAQKSGGVGSFDESLSERLVAGRPFILLDNLRGRIDSTFLEAVLTAPETIGARIPHKGEVYVTPRRFFFTATSNGLESTEDLANRACIIRLRKRPREYRFADWPEGGLVEHIRARQPYYLACAHSLAKCWIEGGKPIERSGEHSFREWAGALSALVAACWPHLPPMLLGHRQAQERTSNPALTWLRTVALGVIQSGRTGEHLSASAIAEACEELGVAIPGLRDTGNEEHARKIVGSLLARCFGGEERLELDGVTVTRSEVRVAREDSKGNYTAKSYSFERLPHNPHKGGITL